MWGFLTSACSLIPLLSRLVSSPTFLLPKKLSLKSFTPLEKSQLNVFYFHQGKFGSYVPCCRKRILWSVKMFSHVCGSHCGGASLERTNPHNCFSNSTGLLFLFKIMLIAVFANVFNAGNIISIKTESLFSGNKHPEKIIFTSACE